MLPFHCTVELEMKLLPLTVSVKALPPTVVDAGEVELTVGTGLGGGCEFDPPDEEPPRIPPCWRAQVGRLSALGPI